MYLACLTVVVISTQCEHKNLMKGFKPTIINTDLPKNRRVLGVSSDVSDIYKQKPIRIFFDFNEVEKFERALRADDSVSME